jgi:hypothetical protein
METTPALTFGHAPARRAYGYERLLSPETKKADVAEHPKVFDHVGLLTNEPPGTTELLFI